MNGEIIMPDLETRVTALELQHAVADERWKQIVERLDCAAKDRVRTDVALEKIADQLTAFKLADAKQDGAKSSVTTVMNWGMTIFSTLAACALAMIEFFRPH